MYSFNMLNKVITYLYYLLFLLTPFLFTKWNFELFEYNKMMFVYLMTILIVGFSLIRMITEKRFIFKRTPLDIPLLLFLASQIISTFTSIDPHTSLFGYYSRSNGGLFSTISYLLLYWALAGQLSLLKDDERRAQILQFFKVAIVGAFVISLWGILEHFGYSLSCWILTGNFGDSCWQQDVQARVFASLGQPNWLAAYLGMLLFPTLYFALTETAKLKKGLFYLFAVLNYLAFTFTNSRGAAIGIVMSFALFVLGYIFIKKQSTAKKVKALFLADPVTFITIVLIVITLLFGSGLTSRFKLINQSTPAASVQANSGGSSALDNGGTDSGQIRLIVWKGAVDIFKHYPIFGSGVETFGYSYYQFRPVEHNLVSEWDFLYNKAHNEYLNYLATTGAVGLATYLIIIIVFIAWCIKILLAAKGKKPDSSLFIIAILASYIFYLIQNTVQFSVVDIALFFFIFPAMTFLFLPEKDLLFWPFPKLNLPFSPNFQLLDKRTFYARFLIFLLFVSMGYLIFTLSRNWQADVNYAKGSAATDSGNPGEGFNLLLDAVHQNPNEPIYHSQLGFAAVSASVALQSQDATLAGVLKKRGIQETQTALSMSPANVSLWRTAIQTYYELATVDPSYFSKTIQTIDHTSSLAPTDPKLLYNKALVLGQMQKDSEAIDTLNQALKLKPNYHDALVTLAQFYAAEGQKDKAKEELNITLKYFPSDPEASQAMQLLQSK